MMLVKVYFKGTVLESFILPFGAKFDFSVIFNRYELEGYDLYTLRCVVSPVRSYDGGVSF